MLTYLLIINAVAFAVMLYDKNLAKNHAYRVPEKSLFAIAAFGGSAGCLLAMYTVHHKTRHRSFKFGMPAILAAQLLLGYFILM